MCISTTRFPTLRVAMLATLLGAGAAQGQAVDERVSRCDALASYPADPGRYAAGVTDEQFAPGAAVDACRAAVDADPQLPRSWFQLGRSYWIAQRDEEALAAFVEAAKLGYAPAMKFIGDAYNEGRGLPPGEQQSLDTAIAWYKKAEESGFRDARRAVEESERVLASLRFDPSGFQNPNYMTRMYDGEFEKIENPILFLRYVRAFSEELGGTNIFFIDQDCQGMVTTLGSTINGFQQLSGYLTAAQTQEGMGEILLSLIASSYIDDQGMRDAGILMSRYKCNSPITRKIVNNVVGSYEQLPAIITASVGKPRTSGSPAQPTQDPVAPLNSEKIRGLYWGALSGRCGIENYPSKIDTCNRLLALIKSDQYKIVQCSYGPFYNDGTGYQIYMFWLNQTPKDFSSYDIPGGEHPFSILGKLAVERCPENSTKAAAALAANRP